MPNASPADAHEGEPYAPTASEFLRGGLLTAFGVLMGILARKASIPVVSSIVIFVAGFDPRRRLLARRRTQEAWKCCATRKP